MSMDKEASDARQPSPIPWGLIILMGGGLIVALTLTVVAVLGPYDLNNDKKLRLDAFKLVLTGIAGYGAAVTVWLALRRQHHFEHHSWNQHVLELRKQAADDLNNQSRRALDLYSAAAEQLGSEHAAVRLAGVYTFERLASEEAAYRQTVVDVFCAYLRMGRIYDHDTERQAELEVRSSVQSLLLRHLRPPDSPLNWANVRVNLSGAILRDFDASGTYFTVANFKGAQFLGETTFDRAAFVGKAGFGGCKFSGRTSFRRAQFDGGADFDSAEFEGVETGFTGARFSGSSTQFRQAKLLSTQVIFRAARFSSVMSTNFSKALFGPTFNFKRAKFSSRITSFNRAEMPEGITPFMMARFSGPVLVDDAVRWNSVLRGAHVLGEVRGVGDDVSESDQDDEHDLQVGSDESVDEPERHRSDNE
ncbi:pentapeptide repeat-containing protein [Micromonospora sp. NPDC047467]|uniref:pentapeptide repeat-containing protein n=1 Tax=Micromonospora sp. NPDC047467 TaxID=3154814 RepID=UPI0033FCF074